VHHFRSAAAALNAGPAIKGGALRPPQEMRTRRIKLYSSGGRALLAMAKLGERVGTNHLSPCCYQHCIKCFN
jgi:hypothetical protein